MSSFTNRLLYTEHGATHMLWRVELPFSYEVGHLGSGHVLTVPQGFVTDFASVPWPFSIGFNKEGRTAKAAVLHDWLYKEQPFSRVVCDAIFMEAMAVAQTPRWKRQLFFWCVRLCGKRRWKRARWESVAGSGEGLNPCA